MEGGCKNIEQAVVNSQQVVVFQLWGKGDLIISSRDRMTIDGNQIYCTFETRNYN
jgi:hypothetical protein